MDVVDNGTFTNANHGKLVKLVAADASGANASTVFFLLLSFGAPAPYVPFGVNHEETRVMLFCGESCIIIT